MARLMVLAGCFDGSTRQVIASETYEGAAERLGISVDRLRRFGSETFNPDEIAMARAKPGVVFWSPNDDPGAGYLEEHEAPAYRTTETLSPRA